MKSSGLGCLLILAALNPAFAMERSPCPFCCGATAAGSILNVAHAGASSLAPQNTLAAGRAAFAAGADVWGVDARRTRDGVFVLMHDETLARTTNVEEVFPARSPWRVADFLLSEIRSLDAGSWFVQEDPFDQVAQGNVSADALRAYVGEPVPTLREALEFVAANDGWIDIEIKAPLEIEPETVAAELLVLLRKTGTADCALVSSFDRGFLVEVRHLAPTLPIGALTVLPLPDPLETLRSLGVAVYLPSVVGFTDALLEDLEQGGIPVIVWTYNTADQLEYALDLPGIDGIYTDFPQRLAALLEERTP